MKTILSKEDLKKAWDSDFSSLSEGEWNWSDGIDNVIIDDDRWGFTIIPVVIVRADGYVAGKENFHYSVNESAKKGVGPCKSFWD